MTSDPAIDEIRRIRHEISQEVDHDLHRLTETFALLESQFKRPPIDRGGRRLVRGSGAAKPLGSAAGTHVMRASSP